MGVWFAFFIPGMLSLTNAKESGHILFTLDLYVTMVSEARGFSSEIGEQGISLTRQFLHVSLDWFCCSSVLCGIKYANTPLP